MAEEEKTIQVEFSLQILMAEQVLLAAQEAESYRVECSEVGNHVHHLSQLLRSTIRHTKATPALYERPFRLIIAEVSNNLNRALFLVRECKNSGGVLCRLFTFSVSITEFRKVLKLLKTSHGDLKWLLNILHSAAGGSTGDGGFPPIANNDPVLSWVWSYSATIQMGSLSDRVEAANALALFALNNERYRLVILKEGGVPPLLKLLKEGGSPDAQFAAATALFNLATDKERVRHIGRDALGIPVIAQAVFDTQMKKVQILLAKLVSTMVDQDPDMQEEFGKENVIRPLVSLLLLETTLDEPDPQLGKAIIHSQHSNSSSSLHYVGGGSSSMDGHDREEMENEKLALKISCVKTLWMLSKGSVSNSRRIIETKGMLCLVSLMKNEQGELQENCLKTILEIASAVEVDADIRSAFKTNSLVAKAVVDQLLRVIIEESVQSLQILAIQAIGSLARTFPARETTRVIAPLVTQLSHTNQDLATQATISLGKFACLENFLCVVHSKTIIEFEGVIPLLRLLSANEHAKLHGLILLCYMALHADNIKAMKQAKVLSILFAFRSDQAAQHPSLRELLPRATNSLELYEAGIHPYVHLYDHSYSQSV